jgi:lactate dehydrogenase-like 2-hydroxyacid dehydrogenase
MTTNRWTIGITHLIKPPFDPELEAFGGNLDIVYFAGRDAAAYAPEELQRLDAMLVWTPRIDAATVAQLNRCKILVRYGVGYDKIDRSALAARDIAFSNNPEYGPEDVADTAMAMLLALQRRIVEHDSRARAYHDGWQENHLSPMRHSKQCRAGIVGLGRIGSSLALRLKPFGYEVVAYDPYVSNGMFRALDVARAASLDELVGQVDAVSMHCPLSAETQGMFSGQVLAQAKPGLIFVNTARGGLTDLDVIESGLRSGQLAAAGLDVLPEEPPAAHALIDAWRAREDWLQGRLLITPHNAFYSDHSFAECRYNAAQTARLFLEQQLHRNAV